PRVPWYPAGARAGGTRAAAGAGLRLAVHVRHRGVPGIRLSSRQHALRRRRTADRRRDLRFVGRRGRGERRVGGGARASRRLVPECARGRRGGAGGLSIRSVVIHGHFYQPPREDAWLVEVAAEPSAAPFHDWNERIEQECYRAVVAARLYALAGRIARNVNTIAPPQLAYARVSGAPAWHSPPGCRSIAPLACDTALSLDVALQSLLNDASALQKPLLATPKRASALLVMTGSTAGKTYCNHLRS